MDTVTMILLGIALIFVVFLLTVFVLLVHSGLLHQPTVTTATPPLLTAPNTLMYKFLTGPYSGSLLSCTFTEAASLLGGEHKDEAHLFGIFYDDPNLVAEDRLRCAVGCLVTPSCRNAADLMERLKAEGFKSHTSLPIEEAVLSSFPYTTPFSIWLAPHRVYPQLTEYIKKHDLCAYPMLEVYIGSTIHYVAPLSKQQDFFVPECAERCESNTTRLAGAGSGDEASGSEAEHRSRTNTASSTGSSSGSLVHLRRDMVDKEGVTELLSEKRMDL